MYPLAQVPISVYACLFVKTKCTITPIIMHKLATSSASRVFWSGFRRRKSIDTSRLRWSAARIMLRYLLQSDTRSHDPNGKSLHHCFHVSIGELRLNARFTTARYIRTGGKPQNLLAARSAFTSCGMPHLHKERDTYLAQALASGMHDPKHHPTNTNTYL